jgi:outer membrane protein insertion porin family
MLLLIAISGVTTVCAEDLLDTPAFTIQSIRVEGLQRIPVATVYRLLPFEEGQTLRADDIARATHDLYATGNFQDIGIYRQGNSILVRVAERPSISEIELTGNKAITKEDLLAGLSRAGLAKGSVFKRATLERIQVELERQYVAQGRYGAQVTAEVVPQPRNRVAINIKVREGDIAKIRHINIVGGQEIAPQKILKRFQLKETHLTSFFKGDNKYARERLSGDLETLRSYYMDRGYINFTIESTQVAVDPSKESVYITINISEGKQFKVGKVELTGHFPIPESELQALIVVKPDQTFSRRLLTLSEDLISKKLGNAGFTFATVKGIPDIQQDKVNINFFVEPGKRVYVRRITFGGNEKTSDEVLRREMRQMEGAWASGEKIEQSKIRLERLGFFKGVKVATPAVPGTDDQVDVDFSVEEQPSGSISASIGYQNGAGVVFGASVSQRNFLGTGNQVGFELQRTQYRNSYNFNYRDPYFTVDGVSRGYSVYFQETDFSDTSSNLSRYRADAYGGNINFGYPINEDERISFALGFDDTTIKAGIFSPDEVREFIDYDDTLGGIQNQSYQSITLTSSWRRSTLNKGILPDRGASNNISLETALPGLSDLEYYKLDYQGEKYLPLPADWVLRLRTELGYGDGLGGTSRLPFYKHFYTGGITSVRGYETRSLGPQDSAGDAFGGDMLVETGAEFIFPVPFLEDKRSVRTLFFIDAGNVFDTNRTDEAGLDISASNLRIGTGFGLSWITAIGPLSFTLSRAYNDSAEDQTQVFDFSLGQTF